MENRILYLATESDMHTSNMDVGNVNKQNSAGSCFAVATPAAQEYQINTREKAVQPTGACNGQPAVRVNAMTNGVGSATLAGRPNNPDIICYTCNERGHISGHCQKRQVKGGAAKGEQWKGGWVSKGTKGQPKGGWNTVSSKGWGGKGKGAYAVGEWVPEDWYWEPAAFAGCIEETLSGSRCSCHEPLISDSEDVPQELLCGVCEDDLQFEDEEEIDGRNIDKNIGAEVGELETSPMPHRELFGHPVEQQSPNQEDRRMPRGEFCRQPDTQPTLNLNDWPCQPIISASIQQYRERMLSRNIPVSLTEEEWTAARARVKTMMDAHDERVERESWTEVTSKNKKNRSARKRARAKDVARPQLV